MDEEQVHHVVISDDMVVRLIPLAEEGYWYFKENNQRVLEIRWETSLRATKNLNSKS